jgi:nucleotide-binding universal stress UspA family protein
MARVQTVLYPTDLSTESLRAFDHARLLAERFGARLTLYHALVPRYRVYEGLGLKEGDRLASDTAENEARAQLTSLAQPLQIPYEIVVERNLAVPALADLAVLGHIERTQPDITVMATHSREGVGSYFVGTVAEQVVRATQRPVLVVRKGPHDIVTPYRRILVTTDLSAASQHAFPWSRLLAAEFSAEVTALHVTEGPAIEMERQVAELGRVVLPQHEGVAIRPVVSHGRAASVAPRVSAAAGPFRDFGRSFDTMLA